MTQHAHDHVHSGAGCCSDTPEQRARLTRARRLVATAGAIGVALALLGLAIGGWWGAVLVVAVAAGMTWQLQSRWRQLSGNDRLLRLAVVLLLLALSLVRAIPR